MKSKFYSLCAALAWLAGICLASAQNTTFTYQGQLLDNGTNFTGLGQFEFALVTGTNANQTAIAIASPPINGFLTAITVTNGGAGYTNAPAVTFTGGGGISASATAVVSNGIVVAININPGGNGTGYTSTPLVTVAPPPSMISYTTYWSNDGSSVAGSQPTSSVGVAVNNGLFTIVLGNSAISNMAPINSTLFSQPGLQLQIWFSDGVQGFAALNPSVTLTPVPYAAFANNASNLLGVLPAAQLTGTVASATLPTSPVFTGLVTATNFSGSGAALTSLNAGSLSSGIVPLAQLAGITSNQLDAASWQLATNLNGGIAALASNVVAGISITGGVITASSFTGNGGGFTNLNASQLVSIGNTNATAAGNFYVGPSGNATLVGYNNTAIGVHALVSNTNGINNTASGLNTLQNNTGGDGNTANGAYALQNNTTGGENTASGDHSLFSNTNGGNNTAIGVNALYNNISGSGNTASGAFALQANTNGLNNTALGYNALDVNKAGSNNIAIGYQAGQNILLSSNIEIGAAGLVGDANLIRIGTSQAQTFIAGINGTTVASGVAVYVTSSGQLGNLTSSAKFKDDIKPMNDVSEALLSLQPVTFKYKPSIDPQGIPQFGLVAEQVDKVDPDLVARDAKGGIYTVRYEAVNAMLLNEFLKQHRKVEEQNREIEFLQEKAAKVDALEKRLNELQTAVNNLAAQK